MNQDGKLPTNVWRSSMPPQISDEVAAGQLGILLCDAATKLSQLDQDPLAVAASPDRFDDAWSYEWLAVRCGRFFSEKESYCRQHDLDVDIISASPAAKSAHQILLELEVSAWRDLFGRAFGFSWTDQSLSLVVQDGQAWLVFSSNNVSDDGDPVFTIDAHAQVTYFGEAEGRFDWAIQDPIPLQFRLVSNVED